jgi:hypothetical protein
MGTWLAPAGHLFARGASAMPTTPNARPYWNSGRAFASLDPERQGEVIGFVRSTPADTAAAARAAIRPATPAPARKDWTRMQPDVESGSFEGSSSGRWR